LFARLDPPDLQRLSAVSGDVMAVEARVRDFGKFWPTMRVRNCRAYAGLRDIAPRYEVKDGHVKTTSLGALALLGADYPAYMGMVVPRDPWSTVTGDRHSRGGEANGYTHRENAFPAILTWRRTWNGSRVAWAHNKDILEDVTPGLTLHRADRPAQVRFRLGDLSESKFGPLLQAICYLHARRISAINVDLMHELVGQLQVEPKDADEVAEALLGAKPFCPLGGNYRLTGGPAKAPNWRSTAWQCDSVSLEQQVPEDYRYPLLDWLRGAQMELTLDRITLSTHVELDVKSSADSARRPAVRVTSLKPTRNPNEPPPLRQRPPTGSSGEPLDSQRIQGTWKVIDDRKSGRPLSETVGACLRFESSQIVQLREDVPTHRFRFRLRPELEPTGFDFLPEGQQIWDEYGICRLQGNRLFLCYGRRGDPRPTRFDMQPDDACRMVVLERVGARD
jgi:uncharacterized protein (TIGR03067 family)